MGEKLDIAVPQSTKWLYSVTGLGRDMAYTLVNYFIIYYLTMGLGLADWELGAVTIITVVMRFWDAVNDPVMGTIIDNTRSRWGKFKPWILIGAVLNSVTVFLFFHSFGLTGVPFLIYFTVIYLLWETTYTMNDIGYWSMLPSFSADPTEREKVGSLARVFASLGMFITIGLTPVLYGQMGTAPAFSMLGKIIPVIFLICQMVLVVFLRERKSVITSVQSKSGFMQMFKVLFKNDQLLVVVISILLFNTGYYLTTSFGPYFFDFTFADYRGYSFTIFSGILAVSQIAALSVYPLFAKRFTRRQLFTISIVLVAIGYGGFFIASYFTNIFPLAVAGLFMFSGQAFIQVLVLVMLADTIEYGQYKLGTRNESAVFALQPFVTKLASSLQAGLLSITLILSGLNRISEHVAKNMADADAKVVKEYIAQNLTPEMNSALRLAMVVVPMLLILASYLVFMRRYKLDEKRYGGIIAELKRRAADAPAAEYSPDA